MPQSPYDGPGRTPSWDAFSQDGAADGLPPGPALAALAGGAVADLGQLDEGQLLGVGSAARRLAAHAVYLELMAVAGSSSGRVGGQTPMPALINVTVPVGTLLGWSELSADAGTWGLMDAGTVRDLIAAASRHPRTRWCYTLTGPGGEAIAHACARGFHPWPPPPRDRGRPGRDDPAPRQARIAGLLAELNAVPEPVARGTCDHKHREDRYTPSRKLKHLIRARTARCCAPGCGAQAITSEIDHTVPYPAGETCEHNLSPPCQRHHHAKHAPGWKLEQAEPGIMTWTTPSGRTYTTRPTQYEE